ncbi:MAG TPA: RtcB family protein [Thermoleophilia bacterium]|nr:RtcB family protein [Thermoleophilia bacterium]
MGETSPELGIERLGTYTWRLPQQGDMRVPGIVYADEALFEQSGHDEALRQVVNVATLPGIVKASIAMPDIHWGYGFPIGGVAAMDDVDGVISPGGVGFDINCGVRLARTGLRVDEVRPRLSELMHELMRRVPQGTGARGALRLSPSELRRLIEQGVPFLAERGLATEHDLEHTEEGGRLDGADADAVTQKALQRGLPQVGSLGAGNHFLEVQVVDLIADEDAARAFGLAEGQVVVMIHSGSRGFGHQTCTDHLARMDAAMRHYGFELPDRQLACAPVRSTEGQDYLVAMACACNFAFANRQMMLHEVRGAFAQLFGRSWERLGIELVYDVAHNIAKRETHAVDGVERPVWVHRKGATRAFGPGRPDVPADYREVGQPVIIPGDMGSESWLLAGGERAMSETFGSTCHGAGRLMSRGAARKVKSGPEVRRELEERGIVVKAASTGLLAEEAPYAYKDVGQVVAVVDEVGLSRKVARLRPLGVLKG